MFVIAKVANNTDLGVQHNPREPQSVPEGAELAAQALEGCFLAQFVLY